MKETNSRKKIIIKRNLLDKIIKKTGEILLKQRMINNKGREKKQEKLQKTSKMKKYSQKMTSRTKKGQTNSRARKTQTKNEKNMKK